MRCSVKDPKQTTPEGDEWGDVWVKGDRRVQVVHVRDEAKPLQLDRTIRDGDVTYQYTHAELVAEGWDRDKSLNAMTSDQLRAIRETGRHAETVLGRRHVADAQEIERRIAACEKFDDSELVYSATTLCPCGYGLAYPKRIGMHGAWYCSGILTHRANDPTVVHHSYPFSMYDIKSENRFVRASDNTTTRGVFQPKAKGG